MLKDYTLISASDNGHTNVHHIRALSQDHALSRAKVYDVMVHHVFEGHINPVKSISKVFVGYRSTPGQWKGVVT